MGTYTDNFNLKKPGQDDFYNVDDQNGNMDIIDQALTDIVAGGNDNAAAIALLASGVTTLEQTVSAHMADFANRGLTAIAKNISNTNLDDIINTGFYSGNNLANAPDSNYYYVEVVRHGASDHYIKQRITCVTWNNAGKIYERVKNSVWTGWVKPLTNSDIRVNNGELEFYDGTGWQSVGIQPTKPREARATITSPAKDTYYTVVNVSGKGRLSSIVLQYFGGGNDHSTSARFRITIDGEVYNSNAPVLFMNGPVTTYNFDTFFKESLKVEIMQSKDNAVASTYLYTLSTYSLV